MSKEKVVGRNVAIALGIICIVLGVCLVGAIVVYTSTINSLDSQITSLNSQITGLNSVVDLDNSTVWVDDQTISQPAGYYTHWVPTFSASYAGYVVVRVLSSTTSNTYVEVVWSEHGANYDNTVTVGTSGAAVFPVLPGSIDVRVGNTNLINNATETVTITYYY